MSDPARGFGTGARISRPPVYRITVVQLVVLLGLWAGVTGVNSVTAKSLGLGGLIAVVSNAWFALGVFRWRGASNAQRAVRASYMAEIGKFLLAVAGFMLVFAQVRPIEGWAVFAGYGAMLGIQIAGAWWLLRRRPRKT